MAIVQRLMRGDEHEAFFDLVEAAFGFRDGFERFMDVRSLVGPDDTWLALDGDRPVASVQIFDKSIRLRGRIVTLGGIGSVATHPDYERRGIATALLRRAIEDMRRRGHALSLLFTGRTSFYERLDFVQVHHPMWSIWPGDSGGSTSRPFQASDLSRVQRIYDFYNLRFNASTVRDPAYWRDQLRYAGNPTEDFRVAERGGAVQAYARVIHSDGLVRVSEHGRSPHGAEALAELLCEMVPESGPLIAHCTDDAALAAALRARAGRVDEARWGDTMWRVLDRPRLLAESGLPASASDEELLTGLIGGVSDVYWTSDRF